MVYMYHGVYVYECFIFLGADKLLSNGAASLFNLTAVYEGYNFISLLTHAIVSLFYFSHLRVYKVVSPVSCISLIANDARHHLASYYLDICISSLKKSLLRFFFPVLKLGCLFITTL